MPWHSYWAMFSIAPTHGNNVLSVFGVFQCSAITLCLIHVGHHPVRLANHRCGGLIVRLSISFPFGRAIISTGTVSEAFSTCESILL